MPYQHVKAWRKRVKSMLVTAFGGQCGCCAYSACNDALEFHHLDPSVKDTGISSWIKAVSFPRLAEEAKKCVLLCANCHREVHAAARVLPAEIKRFDQGIFEALREAASTEHRTVQSATAAIKKRGSWEGIDVVQLRNDGLSWSVIAKRAHVSNAAVQKRYRRLINPGSPG